MTLTFEQAARKLDQTGKLMPTAVAEGLKHGGRAAQDIADTTGGRMRNLGRNGANLVATLKLGRTEAYVKPKPRGAWSIAEDGARPHIIGAKGVASKGKTTAAVLTGGGFGRRGRRKGAKAIVIPGVGPRAYANHPGAKARRVWTKAVNRMEQVVPPLVTRTIITQSIRKAF